MAELLLHLRRGGGFVQQFQQFGHQQPFGGVTAEQFTGQRCGIKSQSLVFALVPYLLVKPVQGQGFGGMFNFMGAFGRGFKQVAESFRVGRSWPGRGNGFTNGHIIHAPFRPEHGFLSEGDGAAGEAQYQVAPVPPDDIFKHALRLYAAFKCQAYPFAGDNAGVGQRPFVHGFGFQSAGKPAYRAAESVGVGGLALSLNLLVLMAEACRPCCFQVYYFVVADNGAAEGAADLQAGAELHGGGVGRGFRFGKRIGAAPAQGHAVGKPVEHGVQVVEIRGDKQLGLLGGDVEAVVGGINGVGEFLHTGFQAVYAFAYGRKQPGPVNLKVVCIADQPVLHGPPVQVTDQRHFAGFAHILFYLGKAGFRRFDFLLRGIRIRFQDGEVADGFVQFIIAGRGEGFGADLAEKAEVGGIFGIGDDGGMAGCFVDDIGRRGVGDLVGGTDIGGDHQHIVSLELHKRRRGDKPVDRHGRPADLLQDAVHAVHVGDGVDADPGFPEAVSVRAMGVPAQKTHVLPHHVTPYRVILRGIGMVRLINHQAQQVAGQFLQYFIQFHRKVLYFCTFQIPAVTGNMQKTTSVYTNKQPRPKVYAALPVLNESENIRQLIADIRAQDYPDWMLLVCVNQPEQWHDMKEKAGICRDNALTMQYLAGLGDARIVVIDRSSRGKGWIGRRHGVGWARKTAMDAAAAMAGDGDMILSLDADTRYLPGYFSSVVRALQRHPGAMGLSAPYYHSLTGDETADRCILRYEIYMRNYAINMMIIRNPYCFSAIGSGMACTAAVYRKVGGLTPKMSGEDFYFIQKLRKAGPVIIGSEVEIFPAARFSDRVYFGTGPAMIRGRTGNWDSYPVYVMESFGRIAATYALFPELYKRDLPVPLDDFLLQLSEGCSFWEPLRTNASSAEAFGRACMQRLDGLRILQFLKADNDNYPLTDEEKLSTLLASEIFTDAERTGLPVLRRFDECTVQELDAIRNALAAKERKLQQQIQLA